MVASPSKPFAQRMKDQQISWLRDHGAQYGISLDMLDARHGRKSWVLKYEHRDRSLFLRDWWRHLAGKEHRWARALNSSQCFAVNLFGPLGDDPVLARQIWRRLQPQRGIDSNDTVGVEFEVSVTWAKQRLGENEQPTQVDVLFSASRASGVLGHLLIEVKFTESEFGKCRGARLQTPKREGNPNPSRCNRLQDIVADPARVCWLAEAKGRRYWELIKQGSCSISSGSLPRSGPCPFKGGQYQLMRNRLLADTWVATEQAAWADVAVCAHPENDRVRNLDEPVNGLDDIIAAFDSITPATRLVVISPVEVVHGIVEAKDTWAGWGQYMAERYGLRMP